jgi:DNA-binding GntR family transcriptional regulator
MFSNRNAPATRASSAARPEAPIYLKIRDSLAEQIAAGALRRGDRLPPERVLSERFGVTRMTVRQAILHLEGEGTVRRTRRARRGWFVAPAPLRYDPARHRNFARNAREQGREPGIEVTGRERVRADAALARLFGVAARTPLFRVAGIYRLEGLEVCAEEVFLLADAVPGFLDRPYSAPLTDFVAREFDLIVQQIGFHARSARLSALEVNALDVVPGTPCVRILRIKADSTGRIVQVDREAWVASAIEFVVGDVPL